MPAQKKKRSKIQRRIRRKKASIKRSRPLKNRPKTPKKKRGEEVVKRLEADADEGEAGKGE
jgi:hypothetical protein